ncbi:hypothetical protein BGX26_011423 [Mortierella sp. AD094]|nr:hypothetical protein BGX26_011423 [Mortierella sp. AD094]
MSTQDTQEKTLPVVMIAGAGLGGLLLAILLEQINIPYHIFERARELRTLGMFKLCGMQGYRLHIQSTNYIVMGCLDVYNVIGGVMTLGANILPVFEQLGLLEDIMKLSTIYKTMKLYHADMTEMMSYERTFLKEAPELYELLLKQIPHNKISLNKKILLSEEKEGKVFIHCSDNTVYEADILVGADGAFSAVRQSLYKRLDEQGLLPKVDLERFSIGYTLMVGVANPKNLEKYPQLDDPFTTLPAVIGGGYKSWGAVCTPGNQICWTLSAQLNQKDADYQHFRNSEWGPESVDSMIKEFQDCISPLGGTMGDHINDTPKDLISKVFLEEKLFKTWYHGRTVLIGDAAHKMHPAAGLGAVNAFQDVVILANCLYDMKDASLQSITSAFKEYYAQRYDHVQVQSDRSHTLSKLIFGQSLKERMIRYFMFKCMPSSLMDRAAVKSLEYHPKIAWLPPAKNTRSIEKTQ